MSRPRTTWNDINQLGMSRHAVYTELNARRNGTIPNADGILLNEGYAELYGRWCYNATLSPGPILKNRDIQPPTSIETVAWIYDNTQNSEAHEETWTESWENTISAELTVNMSASVELNTSINFFNVASTGMSFSMSTSQSNTQRQEQVHRLSNTWTMRVGPHEKLSLVRTITTGIEVDYFELEYGISSDSQIGTLGNEWQGWHLWFWNMNSVFPNLKRAMAFTGVGTNRTFSFQLVREGPRGRTIEPLPTPDSFIKATQGSKLARELPYPVLEAVELPDDEEKHKHKNKKEGENGSKNKDKKGHGVV